MSRVITASEVDRLHRQVAELQQQVKELMPSPAQTPARPGELFEDFSSVPSQETRSDADSLVESITGQSFDSRDQGISGSP